MDKDGIKSILEFFSGPTSIGILLAFQLTSFLLLLGKVILTPEIIIELNLNLIYEKYMAIILITFFLSFFLLIIQIVRIINKKRQDKKSAKELEKIHKNLFNDPAAQKILMDLYNNNNNPVLLYENNQRVISLRTSGMIVRVTNQMPVSFYEMSNPKFPYVLQTFTEEMIKEKLYQNK